MKSVEQLANEIAAGKTVQLSSDFTKGGAILGVLSALGAAAFLAPKFFNNPEGVKWNVVFAGVLFLGLIYLTFYQLVFAAEASLKGKKLVLKKVIGKQYEIDVSQVEKLKSFQSKSTKYTLLHFRGNDGKPEKALILNSNSILFGKEITAGEVIQLAQQL